MLRELNGERAPIYTKQLLKKNIPREIEKARKR
jgi:hypothetical protein